MDMLIDDVWSLLLRPILTQTLQIISNMSEHVWHRQYPVVCCMCEHANVDNILIWFSGYCPEYTEFMCMWQRLERAAPASASLTKQWYCHTVTPPTSTPYPVGVSLSSWRIYVLMLSELLDMISVPKCFHSLNDMLLHSSTVCKSLFETTQTKWYGS